MVQKIHPRGVIWVPSNRPQAGHLSENDDLSVQYEDVHDLDDNISLMHTWTCITRPQQEFGCSKSSIFTGMLS